MDKLIYFSSIDCIQAKLPRLSSDPSFHHFPKLFCPVLVFLAFLKMFQLFLVFVFLCSKFTTNINSHKYQNSSNVAVNIKTLLILPQFFAQN